MVPLEEKVQNICEKKNYIKESNDPLPPPLKGLLTTLISGSGLGCEDGMTTLRFERGGDGPRRFGDI